jgi:hypothetical protein
MSWVTRRINYCGPFDQRAGDTLLPAISVGVANWDSLALEATFLAHVNAKLAYSLPHLGLRSRYRRPLNVRPRQAEERPVSSAAPLADWR